MGDAPRRPRKNPVLTAAVLKRSLTLRGGDARIFEDIYRGVLRDYGLTDDEVEAYIDTHPDEVERLARGERDGDG